MRLMLTLLTILLLYSGCAPKTNSGLIKKNTADNMDEKFDPLSVPLDDEVVIREKSAKNSHINELALHLDTNKPSLMDTAAMLQKKTDGYRVQIYATGDREQAYFLKDEALQIFGKNHINVYIEFDAPYYKIRIGDCPTKEEADRLRRLARSKGYNKAWVVKAMVYEFPELLWRKK